MFCVVLEMRKPKGWLVITGYRDCEITHDGNPDESTRWDGVVVFSYGSLGRILISGPQ
jgi:hypothetical protein